jgi:hypothetical protein
VLPFAVVDLGESHVLRPYWEYLCYIFRCDQCSTSCVL